MGIFPKKNIELFTLNNTKILQSQADAESKDTKVTRNETDS